MLFLFKKVRNLVNSEVHILEEFVSKHTEHLRTHTPVKETVAHVPGQTTRKENMVLTYHVSEEQCEDLKKRFIPLASVTSGESGESLFGKIIHEGKVIGLYLGKSYQYETYWARFWLE